MLSGWLIYNKDKADENRSYIDWFLSEASQQNISLSLIYREDLTIGIKDNQPTTWWKGNMISFPVFAVVRTIDPFLSKHLEEGGCHVFNSSTVSEIANDKALAHLTIQRLDIPMLDSFFLKKEDTQNEVPPLDYPFVLKEPHGRGGSQVYMIEDEFMFKQSISYIHSDYMLVQPCNVQRGKDIRVFVVGKKIVGAVLRQSDSDFRANYKLGGSAELYLLNEQERIQIERIISYFDFGMVGIDFLLDEEGNLLFNEIEDIVGSRTLSAVSDINILQIYIQFIKDEIMKNRDYT
ncbi:ATP-grasp domain-containing protein [Oceanobacillus manasiensis]|uniref:ATP-grasp domain-containing protein n=1 Tax=Oceanobacillus manasiensis TaxID=586413 RepID=UPI0005AB6B3C|nr:hypothetical protein [Oceanobacillus manasiensis]